MFTTIYFLFKGGFSPAGTPVVKTLVLANAVHETSRTAGTGALTLLGAPLNRRTFASKLNVGDYCPGFVASQTAAEREETVFKLQSDGTLARAATPEDSSNGGALVDFTGTVLDVVLGPTVKVIANGGTLPGYTVAVR